MTKLRLIQCGVGGMGKTWWNGVTNRSPDFELVAIVDLVDAPLAEAGEATRVPAERRFKSLEAALDSVEADAILTVTPPAVHIEHARLALARGLHVLTEKPISDSLDNARLMVRLAADAGRQLVVAQNYRFRPCVQTLKNELSRERVGALGHGHVDFYIPGDFTGTFRQTMRFPLLVDMAIHHLDLIRCVTGQNITRVCAQSFRPAWSWFEHQAALKMLLELSGGGTFSYSGDWTARGRPTTWNGAWRLQCANGSLHMENDQVLAARCDTWGNNPAQETIEIPPMPLEGQARLLHDFAQAIRANRPAETSGQDNLWSFAAVMAAMQSAQEQRWSNVGDLVAGST